MRRKLVTLEVNWLINGKPEWEPPEGWRIVSIAGCGSYYVVVMLESTEAPEGPYR